MIFCTGVFGLYKIASFTLKRRSFLELVCYAKEHFWNIEYSEYGAVVMKKYMNRLTAIVTFAVFMCHLTVAIHYIRPPIGNFECYTWTTNNSWIITLITEDRGKNESDRSFPFALYSDWPLTQTPWYEILYILQVSFGQRELQAKTTNMIFFKKIIEVKRQ